MRTSLVIATATVMFGGLLATGTASAVGNGPGSGSGNGPGSGGGSGDSISQLASGTLSTAQRTRLASMADEEKLALDVYRALARKFPTATVFSRIATSEERHLSLVRQLLARYRTADPTAGKAAGQYASTRLRGLYVQFLKQATGVTAANAVGRAIERDDLAELAKARVGVTAPDVTSVYSTLTTGSQRHLKSFGG